MSAYGSQNSFEKSLRSTNSYQVPLTLPSKTEIHKGCTGKAHACGSKSTNTSSVNKISLAAPKIKVKNDGKPLRKNSLSSETVSDSGSEISSWNSNKDSSAFNSISSKLPPSPLKRTRSVNYGSSCGSVLRRRTPDSVILIDSLEAKAANPVKRDQSMGDADIEKKTEEVSKLRRTSSLRLKNIPPMIPLKPNSPLNPPLTPLKKQGIYNPRSRSSFHSKSQQIVWNDLWESSFQAKIGGGKLKTIDHKLLLQLDKVKN